MAHHDTRSAYEQVAAEIRADIMSGDLEPGQQLPITEKLSAKYEVSAPTVQRALTLLKEEKFIRGASGKGVFVERKQPIQIEAAAYIEPTPGGAAYKVLEVAETRPPADAARLLGLETGDVAVMRHRLMTYADVPAEVSWAYYPTAIARGTELAGKKRIRGGAPRVFADMGLPYRNPDDVVSWRAPTIREAELLELPAGIPVLRTLRVIRSGDGSPVEVSVLIKSGHLFELRYRLFES